MDVEHMQASLRELGDRPGYAARVIVNAGVLEAGVLLYGVIQYLISPFGEILLIDVFYALVLFVALLLTLPGAFGLAAISPPLPRSRQRVLAIGGCAALFMISWLPRGARTD